MSPTVSIVIPCFNAARFLRETIDSALNQSLSPLEIIVVDDGSVDDSAAVAESYGPRVRVIRQPNHGPSIARNVGTAASRGEFVLYLDADDLIASDSLRQLAAAVDGNHDRVALMQCAAFDHDPSRPTIIHDSHYDAMLPHIIRSNLRNPICWLTPRALFDRVGGFSDETRPFEDWDFWAQIALISADLKCVPYLGGFYRRHHASIMSTVSPQKRVRGHVKVAERLARGLLEREALLNKWGKDMFWSAWTALQAARQVGLPWRELGGLCEVIRQLISRGPKSIRSSRYARMVRLLGVPLTESVRSLVARESPWSSLTGAESVRCLSDKLGDSFAAR